MKKIIVISAVLIGFILTGCAKKNQDPYVSYRSQSESQIFNGAEHALAKKDYATAVKMFEALDAIYPFGRYSRQAQLDIIYAYYRDDDDASAIAAADRYTRLYPQDRNVDYAFYMRGIVGFTLGLSWLQKKVGTDPAPRDISSLRQSFSAFALLVHNFPDSHYSADALLHMAYIRNLLAKREVETAQFYMERKAYVAAANRASSVVQHFRGSPSVIKALVIMVKAYRQLGLTQLANKSYRILAASYPQSKELVGLRRS